MAKRIEAFEADDGTIHRDECACAERNIDLLVDRCRVSMQPATANALKAWMKGKSSDIITALREYHKVCPQSAIGSTRPTFLEASEGPAVEGVSADAE